VGKGHFLQVLVAAEGGKTADATMKLTADRVRGASDLAR
jgi:hypothetical protein